MQEKNPWVSRYIFNCLYIRAADKHDRQISDTSWTSVWTGFPSRLPLGQIGLSPQCLLLSHTDIFTVIYIQFIIGANSVGSHLIHAGSNIQVQEEPGNHRGSPGPRTGNCPQWSKFHISVDWQGAKQERRLGSKLNTFKLNWNFQLRRLLEKKENVLWSNETREMLGQPRVRPPSLALW